MLKWTLMVGILFGSSASMGEKWQPTDGKLTKKKNTVHLKIRRLAS